jgi:hypothetical protein
MSPVPEVGDPEPEPPVPDVGDPELVLVPDVGLFEPAPPTPEVAALDAGVPAEDDAAFELVFPLDPVVTVVSAWVSPVVCPCVVSFAPVHPVRIQNVGAATIRADRKHRPGEERCIGDLLGGRLQD